MHQYPNGARPEVADFVPRSARRLLDVGCARGGFGAALEAERDVEVWGVEPDERAAAVASSQITRVVVGSFPEALDTGVTFDCITFNDVLEHVMDPRDMLYAARPLLADGGLILASIPNIRHASVLADLVLRGRWDYTDDGLLDRTHVRFFTKVTMRELFESAGLEVVQQSAVNLTAMSGAANLLRLIGRRREEFLAEQYIVVGRPVSAVSAF